VSAGQLGLFDRKPPQVDESFAGARRTELGAGAWIEYVPHWVKGHEQLFETLLGNTTWRHESREMYERVVEVPRLYAVLPADGGGHPVLERVRQLLNERYAESFVRTSLAYYRDGHDSVAWHGDYVARRMEEALVATVSTGAPRRFLLRPKGGGRSIGLSLGWGDLLVMGGTCQRTWQHAVPKVASAGPRISIMFRPKWEEEDARYD
jgi:alkylated DNA repair dioxygenase AlkB